MAHRLAFWLGAGVVAAGVTVGMLAGAGTAVAQTEPDGGGAKTSQSAEPAENKPDSGNDGAEKNQRHKRNFVSDTTDTKPAAAADDHNAKVDADVDKTDTAEQSGKKSNKPEPGQRTAKMIDNVVPALTRKPDRKVVFEKTRQIERVETPDPVETDLIHNEAVQTESTSITKVDRQAGETNFVGRLAGLVSTRSNLELATPMPTQPKITAAASPRIDVPPVVSAIGTAIFGLISFAESVIEGPALALPGSGVTVERSTLEVGDGHVVPADWYFPDTYDPESEMPPERIIYLQHGFLARGVFYDYTASYLAQQTNSVVVAPSLTSNIFATDGMWLGGDQMHQAVADLFLDENPALLQSAHAAGYGHDVLPGQVVLIGHSLGGGLVIDTARYMAGNPETAGELAGVVMLDGVSFTDPVPILEALDQTAPDLPIYNLSAAPYFWNLFGAMDHALADVRGDQFHGVQLLGGLHSDAMIGGNPLIQFGAYLITGYGGPANVAGSQILAASWINDMFEGTETPAFTGDPGDVVTIPTPVGSAFGLVQAQAGPVNGALREVTAAIFGLLEYINFATDVDPEAAQLASVQSQQVASTPTGPTLINVIGTAAWNVLDFASTILAGPPSVPADSSVTVGRSSLDIDGHTVETDWYYPKSGTPDKFIYFQHGFPARAGFYNLTAAELAERNNAIVVAPSITGNIFAADGYSLGADPMHEAVGRLFDGDRAALAASAEAAGYEGDLPEQFVISGHSGGGQLAAGASGYYYDSLDGQESDLVGVLLFDTSATGGALERALGKLPADLPVLHIAAGPSAWNTYGNASEVLVAERPTQFNGVQLIGGTHSDAFRSSALFGLLQPLVALGTGASTPENVEAVQLLSQGWITDMYAGTVYADDPSVQEGIYGTPGTVIDIAPGSRAYVLPGPPVVLSPVDRVILALLESVSVNPFLSAAASPAGSATSHAAAAAPTGVTGVSVGHSNLTIPYGANGYSTAADWYFPTQADGSVQADGVIWLQHGFLSDKSWYSAQATDLARRTNSVVVVPNVSSFPLLGCSECTLRSAALQEATATMFTGDRAALNNSARAAGFEGALPEKFILTGHSAGGGFATAVAGYTVGNGAAEDLLGVVMFDGVSSNGTFAPALDRLDERDIPVYQIAAPPQPWNANGQTTDELVALRPGQFTGVVLSNGSHVDSLIGGNPIIDLVAQLVTRPSPPGNTAAVYTLADGWINDMYAGKGPAAPEYGTYGAPGQLITLGPATAIVLGPAPVVDVNEYLGTWYEVGSVKQFFSIGLVNTKAVYSLNPDGSIRVDNSGNYFFDDGPVSRIVGSAVSVDPSNNKLNVSFFGPASGTPPGNYWIVDLAPDYSWAIVTDSTGSSGFLLSRTPTVSDELYQELLARAYAKGVKGSITRTEQLAAALAAVAA